jgi:hypothetical protein
MPLVDRDRDVWQRDSDAGGVRRGRVDDHDLDPLPEGVGLLAEPIFYAPAGTARS